jgi:hypothetical protein
MGFQKKQYDDDDGRVIVNMDVEGMPWHNQGTRRERFGFLKKTDKAPSRPNPMGNGMTKSEARQYTWYYMLAGLTIGLVFSATWVLFILFCTQIWFR